MSLWDFAARGGSEDSREADQASLLAGALARTEGAANILRKIPGAGLIWRGERLSPVLLVDSSAIERVPGTQLPLAQTFLLGTVQSLLATSPDWLGDVQVLAATPPESQSAIYAAPNSGQPGARVKWNSGQGFLTAGHVAPHVGALVDLTSSGTTVGTVGTVRWANNQFNDGTVAEPDLCIVEDAHGYAIGTTYASTAKAGPADAVTVACSGTAGTIMGFMAYLFMPSQNQTLADCYMSTTQISNYGDSGSSVVSGKDLIGHVVGASANMASYVQDISYLLTEGGHPLRSGLPGLRL